MDCLASLCAFFLFHFLCSCVFFFLSQVVLLSATLPHDILEMTEKFMSDPIRILVKRLVLNLLEKFLLAFNSSL